MVSFVYVLLNSVIVGNSHSRQCFPQKALLCHNIFSCNNNSGQSTNLPNLDWVVAFLTQFVSITIQSKLSASHFYVVH